MRDCATRRDLVVALRDSRIAAVKNREQRVDETADARGHLLLPISGDPAPEVLELGPLSLQLIQILVPLRSDRRYSSRELSNIGFRVGFDAGFGGVAVVGRRRIVEGRVEVLALSDSGGGSGLFSRCAH